MLDGKVNNIEQLCSVKIMRYTGGVADDERIIEIDNGCLNFTLLLNHALDIYTLRHRGTNISFITKNGLNSFSKDFDGAFNGGMLYICGLDTVGGRTLPIHGKIHNIPAVIKSVNNNGKSVEIIGTVRQCSLFGENLVLKRRIYTEYNSGKITVSNEIINEGDKSAEYCVLFHMNIGYPMLDEGVEVIAPIISSVPRTDYAKKNFEKRFIMENPIDDEEQVFYNKVKTGNVKVANNKIGKAVEFNYDNVKLPYFIEWKSMVKGDYALGIEPSTTTLDDEFIKNVLEPNEKEKFDISIEVK